MASVGFIVWISVTILQSERFARIVLKEINSLELLQQGNVNLKHVEIVPLNLATKFNDFTYNYENIKLQADYLLVSPSLSGAFKRSFEIDHASLVNSRITISDNFLKSPEKKPKDDLNFLIQEIKKMSEIYWSKIDKVAQIVRKITIINSNFEFGVLQAAIDKLSISINRGHISIYGSIHNIIYEQFEVDELAFDILLTKNTILVNELVVRKGEAKTHTKGKIDLLAESFGLNLNYLGRSENMIVPGFKMEQLKSSIKLEAEVFFQDTISIKGRLDGEDIEFNNAQVEKVQAQYEWLNNEFKLSAIEVMEGGNSVLRGELKIDTASKKLDGTASLEGLSLSSILNCIGVDQDLINLNYYGGVKLNGTFENILIALSPQSVIKDLNIDKNLLKLKDLKLYGNSTVAVNTKKNSVDIYANAVGSESMISFTGAVGTEKTIFNAKSESFSTEVFNNNIAGLNVVGKGSIDIHFDKKLVIDTAQKDFVIDNYILGNVSGEIEIDFEKKIIKSEKIEGRLFDTYYTGNFAVNMGDVKSGKDWLFIGLDISKGKLRDIYRSIEKTIDLNEMILVPHDSDIVAKSLIKIGDSEEKYTVQADGSLQNLIVLGQELGQGDLAVKISSSVVSTRLRMNELSRKESIAFFSMNLESGYIESEIKISEAIVSRFIPFKNEDFQNNTLVNLDFYSSGTIEEFSSRTRVDLTTINKSQDILGFNDSYFNIYTQAEKVFFSAGFFNNKLQVEGFGPLSFKNTDKTFLKITAEGVDLMNFFKLSGIQSSRSSIYSDAAFELIHEMPGYNFDKSNSLLKIQHLHLFDEENKYFEILDSTTTLVEGNLGQQKLLFGEGDNKIQATLQGKIGSSGKIEISSNFNPLLLNQFLGFSLFSNGEVNLRSYLSLKDQFGINSEFNLVSDEIKLPDINLPLKDVRVSVSQSGLSFNIHEFNGNLSDGKMISSGRISFDKLLPDIHLYTQVSDSHIYLSRNSDIIVDSKLLLQGAGKYQLSGDVKIKHGKISDQPNLIRPSFKPERSRIDIEKYLDVDVDILVGGDLNLLNNMLDLHIGGNSKLIFKNAKLQMIGTHYFIPGKSKIKIKGYDFNIRKGNFTSEREAGIFNYNLLGEAKISEYSIFIDIVGNNENYQISFRSEPFLSQEDILSLLTLGIPINASRTLGAAQMRSVTGIGVGNILFDQFGVNEGLDKALGVRLSILPDYQDDEINPIRGRSATSEVTARTRTATKIRLERKISKNVDMSFSSTLGTDTQNTQEMNIDYKINRNWSVQGVYEIKNTDPNQANESGNSFGLDLLWKKTFK